MSERERRAAENESVFRAVNDRIEELAGRLGLATQFVCECEQIGCLERFEMELADYQRVRAHDRRFVVKPGHERPEFERVVDEGRGWLVVQKTGEAGEEAAALA